MMHRNLFKKQILIAFLLAILVSWLVNLSTLSKIASNIFGLIVVAQTLSPEAVAAEVYQRLQQLPLENQYISQETGEIDGDNTLISRLIRYHDYVKSRPLGYRLDWKLTIADYLGANEPIRVERYPGSQTLQTNPLDGDRAVIKSLSRSQRNELVDTLVSIYNPQSQSPRTSNSSPQSSPSDFPAQPQLPQPGDAELLLP
jgi:hypothetical protein